MALQNPKLFGYEIKAAFTDVSDPSLALKRLNVAPFDLEVIRGSANKGMLPSDWRSFSRLTVPLVKTTDRYRAESSLYIDLIGKRAGTNSILFGNLDVNGSDIVSVSNGDIDIKPHGSGNIVLDGHTWPNSDGSSGQFLKTNGSGTLSFDTVSSAADDLTTGDSAVSLATSAGNITIDAQGNDTDIIFKGTDGGSDITMLTLDGSAAGNATFNAGIVIADAGNIGSASDTDALAISSGGVVTFTQQPVINSGVAIDNITIDGTEIDLSSGDLTLDVAGDIILDADGGDVKVSDGGTHIGTFTNSSSDFVITSAVQDKDIILKGDDGGSAITALTVDMSAAGKATFNNEVVSGSHISVGGSNNELRFYEGSNYVGFEAPALSADQIWVLPSADGSANQTLKTDGSGNELWYKK